MKKGLLLLSLVLLFTCLGLEIANIQEYPSIAAVASLGTFLVGFAYPTY